MPSVPKLNPGIFPAYMCGKVFIRALRHRAFWQSPPECDGFDLRQAPALQTPEERAVAIKKAKIRQLVPKF